MNYTIEDMRNEPVLFLAEAFEALDDWYLELQDTAIPASPVTITEYLELS